VLNGSRFTATTSEALMCPHPIPPHHIAACASSGAQVSIEESDEETNAYVFLNTTMFSNRVV
jgi:hypothetical protein